MSEGFPSGRRLGQLRAGGGESRPAHLRGHFPTSAASPPTARRTGATAFLPAQHQAIVLGAQQPIRNLRESPGSLGRGGGRHPRAFLVHLNERHAAAHPGDIGVAGADRGLRAGRRGCSFRPPRSRDLGGEPESIRKLYGTDDPNPLKAAYARNCLLARRLLERGVRYVNLVLCLAGFGRGRAAELGCPQDAQVRLRAARARSSTSPPPPF